MTLTQQDLSSIGEIVEEKVKTHVREQIKLQLKPIKTQLNSIKKDLNWVIGRYDSRLVHLEGHAIHPPGRAAS